MDLKLTEEERLIKNRAAQFVDRELISREGDYLRQYARFLPAGAPARRRLQPAVSKELAERARQAGLWCLEVPEKLGGSPLSVVARVLVHREFGRAILPFRPVSIPAFLFDTPYGEKLASGEISLALAFEEAHKTGELSALQILYRQEPDGTTLRDSSIFVSNSGADLFLFPAREQGSDRLGLFVIERDAAGMSITDEVDLTTDAAVARLVLRQCKIPNDRLLGYEYEAGEIIASEQLNMAARSLGIAMRCLASAIEHARNRVTFGRRLAERQAVQWMLADLSVDIRTCTWLTLEAASRADQELTYFEEAALAKKRATKMAFQAADTAIQIHGGYGVCKEFPFEGFYREARLMRLLYGRENELDRAAGRKFLSPE
ncbi:MAG TPA: acyl-CoA dehydrogenase family protein [Terriglobia bacterium]|nr:acyl-CoA dehydrogenase family protein [Terriglobia bacterium]